MDIEKLISNVIKRESVFEKLITERSELLEKTVSLNNVIKKLTESEKRLGAENSKLRDSLKSLEERFLEKYDYKNECSELRKRIARIEEESASTLKQIQKQLHEANENFRVEKESLKTEARNHRDEFQATIKSMENTKQTETEELLKNARCKQSTLEERIREKDAEIVKQKIEYETKAKRMQELIIKLQNSISSNHTGTDIFRKKLQHERDISGRRIVELESQINELQSRLTKPQSQAFITGYSRHIDNATKGGTSKRRKLN